MKSQLLLIIIIVTVLSSCGFSNSEKIRTKEETINAVLGIWKPQKSSSDISSLIFIDKTHYLVSYHVKDGDFAQATGTWSCEDVGTAYLNIGGTVKTITTISDTEMIIGKSEVFEKQKN